MKNSKFSVTFEVLTPESLEAGDFADHGFVDPRTEKNRSLARAKRDRERTLTAARKGRLDWSLRAAVKFLNDNAGGPVAQAEYNWGDCSLRVDLHQDGADIVMGPKGYVEDPNRTNYSLFCENVSELQARVILAALNPPSWIERQAFGTSNRPEIWTVIEGKARRWFSAKNAEHAYQAAAHAKLKRVLRLGQETVKFGGNTVPQWPCTVDAADAFARLLAR